MSVKWCKSTTSHKRMCQSIVFLSLSHSLLNTLYFILAQLGRANESIQLYLYYAQTTLQYFRYSKSCTMSILTHCNWCPIQWFVVRAILPPMRLPTFGCSSSQTTRLAVARGSSTSTAWGSRPSCWSWPWARMRTFFRCRRCLELGVLPRAQIDPFFAIYFSTKKLHHNSISSHDPGEEQRADRDSVAGNLALLLSRRKFCASSSSERGSDRLKRNNGWKL